MVVVFGGDGGCGGAVLMVGWFRCLVLVVVWSPCVSLF